MEQLLIYDVVTVATTSALVLDPAALGSSDDILLRVYNASTQFQAEEVIVAVDDIALWLSLDGDSFTASAAVGDIAPLSTSVPFYLRRVTPTTAAGGSHTGHLSATPTAWTHPADTSTSPNIPLETED